MKYGFQAEHEPFIKYYANKKKKLHFYMTIYHIKFQNISTKSLTILKILKRSVIWLQSGIFSFICLEMAKKKKKKEKKRE